MKKLILAATAVALVGLSAQIARAGDCAWATAGKVLTGVAAGVVIAKAFDAQPAYASVRYSSGGGGSAYSVSYSVSSPAPCLPPARAVCVPAPVVVYQPVVYYAPVAACNYAHGHGPGHGRYHGRW